MNELNVEFITKLSKLYGAFDNSNNKFEKASNSEISRELGYSDAQFSRLINSHATDGEYQRANQNIDRILKIIQYEEKFAKVNVNPNRSLASPRKRLIFLAIGVVIGALVAFLILGKDDSPSNIENSRYDLLRWSFESNFINPYTGMRTIPDDCDYNCYRYQGKWELKSEYKLPFLRERSGFHYLAKSAIMYARCDSKNNPDGKKLEGYEYQLHEIWYDIKERPIGVFIEENGTPLDSYSQIDFCVNENFVKIATIHSFYTNEFSIDSTLIYRSGQDIGRDLEFVPEAELADHINDRKLLEKLRSEIMLIVQDPLKDYSKPSACEPSPVAADDFHSVSAGDEMVFGCQMTTAERFSIDYVKTYVLKDQFIKEKCVSKSP